MVTERVFVTFWEQSRSGQSSAASVRVQLLTIAHRLAMHAALSASRAGHEPTVGRAELPSDPVAAVLSRGQAIERTLASASLTQTERAVAALIVHGRCTSREVARILSVPEQDVNQQLRSGLRHVRTALAALR